MKRIQSKQEYLGFNPHEAAIWRSLVDNRSPQTVTEIAKRSGETRPTVYKYLNKFHRLHLIARTPTAGHVRTMTKKSYLFTIAPTLLSKRVASAESNSNQEVQTLKGKDLKKVWQILLEELPKKGIFYRYDGYSSHAPVSKHMPADFYKKIDKNKLERFVITNYGLRKGVYKKRLECASRMLPSMFDLFEQGVSEFVFNDTIMMVDFTTETAFIIKNRALAAYHRKRFEYLYAHLPE